MQFRNYVFTFWTLFYFSIIKCDMVPIIRMEMINAGFHRDLKYTVEFDSHLAGKECEYYLEQKLPAAVYVSVDQLDDLKRLNKLHANYPTFVDVEIPTEKAKSLTVLLQGVPKIEHNITLPIHFRYHSPGNNSFVDVEISNPNMYMRCTNADLLKYDELLADFSNNYCIRGNIITLADISAPRDCVWKFLKKTMNLKAPLAAKIPIGDAKSFYPKYATIIISWVASIWFVFGTKAASMKRIHGLEELRNTIKKYPT